MSKAINTNRYALTTLQIDLKAIAANYKLLALKNSKIDCSAVIKANAYGLGVAEVAPVLFQNGCRTFFVASLDEAIELRKILTSKDASIAVFYGIFKGEEDEFVKHKLIPVLNNYHMISLWLNHAKKLSKKLPAIIHVDTGINRLGLTKVEFDKFISLDKSGFEIKMLMSHLSCADLASHPLNAKQLSLLKIYRTQLPNTPVTFANSYGIFLGKQYHFDILRPGMALYGLNPTSNTNPMSNVVKLKSTIIQLREIDRKSSIGYGATKSLPKGSVVATIPLGYADGYLRNISNNGYCYINNEKIPVIGRVSMDLITLDVTKLYPKIKIGDEVEVMGTNITVDEVASYAGTIGYEILTSLGKRYKRIYEA